MKEKMYEWKFDLQIYSFYFFKLSEKLAEKQKYKIYFFLEAKII